MSNQNLIDIPAVWQGTSGLGSAIGGIGSAIGGIGGGIGGAGGAGSPNINGNVVVHGTTTQFQFPEDFQRAHDLVNKLNSRRASAVKKFKDFLGFLTISEVQDLLRNTDELSTEMERHILLHAE